MTIHEASPDQVAVEYIGRRDPWKDHLYDTNLTFEKGQVRVMPHEIARKFLRHGDMFAVGKAEKATKAVPKAKSNDDTEALLAESKARQEEKREELSDLQHLRDRVMLMDKSALREFANNNYGQKFGSKDSVDAMRTAAVGFIDQYGAV